MRYTSSLGRVALLVLALVALPLSAVADTGPPIDLEMQVDNFNANALSTLDFGAGDLPTLEVIDTQMNFLGSEGQNSSVGSEVNLRSRVSNQTLGQMMIFTESIRLNRRLHEDPGRA